MRIAVVILSDAGLKLAEKIREANLGEVTVFGPKCVVGECAETIEKPGVVGWDGPMRLALPGLWESHDAIVAIMALGIVVRLIAPLARDKRTDPAIIAVDEAGQFAISVLGGHQAEANRLTNALATAIGAIAVITTASDTLNLPAVDEIGREFGWRLERAENLTRVAAAVVRRQPVVVVQPANGPDWWSRFGPWPAHFLSLDRLDDRRDLNPAAILVIGDQIEPAGLPADRTLIYRTPTLVAGIGCKRGTPRELLDDFLQRVFLDHGLAIASLTRIATVTLKSDEPGLIDLASSRKVEMIAFSPAELADQPGIERPSERVRSKIGISSVAEAAALRAAGSTTLLVPKQIGPGMTIAIARMATSYQP